MNVDALTGIEVAREDGITVDFVSGNGAIDVAEIPGAARGRFPSLVVTGLPPHTKPGNISNVLVHNLEGTVAHADYVAISSIAAGNSATLCIPLIADSSGAAFTDTGIFFVSFVVNVDALIRISIAREDGITVLFDSGNGSIDISDIPDAAQVRVPHLTISGLPAHTRPENISGVFIYNQEGVIAGADYSAVSANASEDSAILRIPLLGAASVAAFTDTGTFHVGFVVNVDALIRINVKWEDGVTVFFDSGNGSIDISDIPIKPKILVPSLTITGLPPNTGGGHFLDLALWNTTGRVARIIDSGEITVSVGDNSSTAIIPLMRQTSDEWFRDSGVFILSFDLSVDALTRITLTRELGVSVALASGSGSFSLSDIPSPPQERRPYLTITGLPPNTRPEHFSGIALWNSVGRVARIDDRDEITVSVSGDSATAQIPLMRQTSDDRFRDSGVFILSFDLSVDALTRITLSRERGVSVALGSGSGSFDISDIPSLPLEKRSYLTLTGLPSNTLPRHFSDVTLWSSSGRVATIRDSGEIMISVSGNSATARIPLMLQSSGDWFRDSGVFILSFDLNIDALTRITLTRERAVSVILVLGNGSLDILNIPDPIQERRPYLAVTGLPPNTLPAHFSDFALWNSSGRIARIGNHEDITVSTSGDSAMAKIPLTRQTSDEWFRDSGVFFLSFDISVDALTRITLTRERSVSVLLTSGSGSFSISDIPAPPQVQIPYLTLMGLPPNTQPEHFSDIALWNTVGRVARIGDHGGITISAYGNSSTAIIPLTRQNSDEWFRDSGVFILSFDLNVDALTRINLTRERGISVSLNSGNGSFDLSNITVTPPVQKPYLTIAGLPSNAAPIHFSNIGIWNATHQVAGCQDSNEIEMEVGGGLATANIPLTRHDSGEWFRDTGTYVITFTANIDALTRIERTRANNVTVVFNSGNGRFDIPGVTDVTVSPASTDMARGETRTFTATVAGNDNPPQNVEWSIDQTDRHAQTTITAAGVLSVANAENMATLTIRATSTLDTSRSGTASVSILLPTVTGITVNPPNPIVAGGGTQAFAATVNGTNNPSHGVSWSIVETGRHAETTVNAAGVLSVANAESLTTLTVRATSTVDDSRSGTATVTVPPPPTLIITGLPINTTAGHFSDVALWNASGRVARVRDLGEITITASGNSATARIPLTRHNSEEWFRDTGTFVVAFTVNVDALNRIVVTREDGLSTPFTSGSGSFGIADIPAPPQVVKSYLTIGSLPANTAAVHFSNVGIWNATHQVAGFRDGDEIEVSVEGESATAKIPLSRHDSDDRFRDTGTYVITFTANIDALTRIERTRANNITVIFDSGNGRFDIPSVTGVTVNPASASVARSGTRTFTATVNGTNGPPQGVTWSIDQTGRHAQTTINANGVLTVAALENTATLTIRATSTLDPSRSGTATVTVLIPTVTGVTVNPAATSIERGWAQTFNATVNGANNPAQGVTWSIVESGRHAQTTINSSGVLTVAATETTATLTIRATSTFDPSRSGTATVTVLIPTVTNVTVTPATASVARGGTQTFSVTVNGTNNPDQGVTWSVVESGRHAQTTISSGGVLTVATTENLASLTIRATSTFDPSRNGTATVTVLLPTVTGVTVTPSTAEVERNATRTFAATVAGANNPPQTVTWSIDQAGRHAQTTINSGGVLTVAAAENLTTLTVRATSTLDTARSGTAIVTVPLPPTLTITGLPANTAPGHFSNIGIWTGTKL